eukprot:TRINITY_DN1901_c0_g1_i2.p1 TRINITY_DN1901_c0_g1~~TRINITY_DN1901_c0_g1_i2.p1  ORF type:complete len:166 (-),score=100.74 TRINITY_DN1901_c0_g1_i2:149-646(-)
MPPKFDPNQETTINVRSVGGEAAPAAVLAPKIGPLGLAPKKVGDDIAKATTAWKGLRVTCKLTIKNRVATVEVIPSAAALVLKALKEPPRDRKKEKNRKHHGNITLNDVYEVARVMRPRSNARFFSGTVKEILGTCRSVGCTVDGVAPAVLQERIDSGDLVCPDA